MDLQMPVMDGLEATQRIRESSEATIAQIPIIGVSANVSEVKRQKCLEGLDETTCGNSNVRNYCIDPVNYERNTFQLWFC